MYKTRDISSFCPETKSGDCGVTSIYDLDQFNKKQFVIWLQSFKPCSTTYYPLWYWITLMISIAGLVKYYILILFSNTSIIYRPTFSHIAYQYPRIVSHVPGNGACKQFSSSYVQIRAFRVQAKLKGS